MLSNDFLNTLEIQELNQCTCAVIHKSSNINCFTALNNLLYVGMETKSSLERK